MSWDESMSSCMAALIVSMIAACGGLLPLICAAACNPSWQPVLGLAATAIRLLLMIAGSTIVIIVTKVDTLWFAAWLAAFYLATLVLEVGFAMRAANSNNTIRSSKA